MTHCSRCMKEAGYLFDDSRCWRCTRLTPEEVRGEVMRKIVAPEDLGHVLWTNDQMIDNDHPDILIQMVVDCDFAVCKKCDEFEAGLDAVCIPSLVTHAMSLEDASAMVIENVRKAIAESGWSI